ncbi:MAG: hypothetical protein WD069_02830 [Planctomycetales bacterium]
MIRKALYAAGAVALLGALIFGRDVFSYARTAGKSMRQAVKSEVPLEFEVERARELVEKIVPDIRHCMHVIAEQQVDVEHITADIARRETSLTDQERVILSLRSDLDEGDKSFVYAGRQYTPEEVRRDLATRFERFKIARDTIDRDRKVLDARQQALVANQQKLDGMLAAKQDLEVQVEQLEARLKTVQAAQTVSTLEIDDSQLARAKSLIRELNKQLDVKEKLLDSEGKFTGLIPVDAESVVTPQELGRDIDTYFGKKPAAESPSL